MPESVWLIVDFVSERLASFIQHQNQLKHIHFSISSFKESFDTVSVSIDYSKNLSIPVKYELSLHWSHSQVTTHSGILKNAGENVIMLIFLMIKSLIKYL